MVWSWKFEGEVDECDVDAGDGAERATTTRSASRASAPRRRSWAMGRIMAAALARSAGVASLDRECGIPSTAARCGSPEATSPAGRCSTRMRAMAS